MKIIDLSPIENAPRSYRQGVNLLSRLAPIRVVYGAQFCDFGSARHKTKYPDTVSVAGMVDVLSFTDTANSLVEDGVKINQNLDWRDYAKNPHENNRNPDLGAADETADEQVVSVAASNYMELINMSGYFSLEFSLGDMLQKKNPFEIDAAASKGKKGGVGGALFVMLIDNTTHSTV
ncbi:MAG: hypothetical protein ACWGQW_21215, partial [bacterium]